MTPLLQALEIVALLSEKTASAATREKLASAAFAAFGLFKQAAIDPAALSSLQRGLGWGVGLGLPALGVGHMLARDAKHLGQDLLRDARNQALLTAAGVGGMQALGDMLKRPPQPQQHNVDVNMPAMPEASPDQKLAAAIMVDDVLESACDQLTDPDAKHAALVQLAKHRSESVHLLRSYLP